MDFVDEIIRVKKPQANLISSLAEQYSAIAFKFGYFEAQSPCWLYFMRKEGQASAFEVQFGNVSEFKASFEKLVKSQAQICFLVTSSLAHSLTLREAQGLLLRNFAIKNQKFVLIDIETGKFVKVNFEWEEFQKGILAPAVDKPKVEKPIFRERRKKIYGKRGAHKEQD